MKIIAGLFASAAIIGLGRATQQLRLLPFYSTVLIVIAVVYVLFAVMAGAPRTIAVESSIAIAFVGLAVTGGRWTPPRAAGLIVAGGLAAHGVYDLVHEAVVVNPVVPDWWPVFCGVVDLVLAIWLGVLASRGELHATPTGVHSNR
jgi:hypothetical protein